MRTILITGAAGFIGFHLTKKLLDEGYNVVGLDNINDYYDVNLKYARLKELGLSREDAEIFNSFTVSSKYSSRFIFVRLALEDKINLPKLFQNFEIDIVCNLAAQAGVRYSLENPMTYVDSNIVGFLNLLECIRHYGIKKLVYASSSSVYGNSVNVPFSTGDSVDHPVSIYAATKKSNELMAHTYSHLFNIKTTGLRFFTVYGPWGRPDMAMFLFTEAIINNKPINIFNNGVLERDFTYINDIVTGVFKVITESPLVNDVNYKLYNIGNSKPVKLMSFIEEIEKQLCKRAIKKMLPMQPGDVYRTWANVDTLQVDFNYNPSTSIEVGVEGFIKWYKEYYQVD